MTLPNPNRTAAAKPGFLPPAARSQRPSHEVVQARVDPDPTAPFVKHTHPGEETIYVLEGSLEYQIHGQPTTTVTVGDVLFVPAATECSRHDADPIHETTLEEGAAR